jgi:GH25 family lysozyme M1 (1,4-beta-N-acetylmuramidase)
VTQPIGVDIAGSYQWPVDYAALAQDCDFAIAKASEGTGFHDPHITQNLSGFKAHSILAFLKAGVSGAAQFDWFLSCVGNPAGVGFALDVENTAEGNQITQFLDRFTQRFPNRSILVYSNVGLWARAGGHDISRYKVVEWHAGSSNGVYLPAGHLHDPGAGALHPTSFGGMTLHPCMVQYTDQATVHGISGQVDADVWTGTLDQLQAITGEKSTPTTEPDMPLTAADAQTILSHQMTVSAGEAGLWAATGANHPAGSKISIGEILLYGGIKAAETKRELDQVKSEFDALKVALAGQGAVLAQILAKLP